MAASEANGSIDEIAALGKSWLKDGDKYDTGPKDSLQHLTLRRLRCLFVDHVMIP